MLLDERVRSQLAATTRWTDIEQLDVTDSTNRVALERASAGEPEGLVVVADLQTSGRGRLDRSWEASPGAGILVSVLLRPDDLDPSRWHLLTAAAGLAALRACDTVGGFTAQLKWPNDLLTDGRKLAGILAEAAGEAVVVGMGLNVHSAPPGAAWADEAAGRRVDRSELLADWLVGLDGLLGKWGRVAEDYRSTCSTIGRRVVVDQSGSKLHGQAIAVDDSGALRVRGDDGSVVTVSAGDVTHVRPAEGNW